MARLLPPESAARQGVFAADLDQWRSSATAALAEPEEAYASPQAARQDRKRIKEWDATRCTRTGRWPRLRPRWFCRKSIATAASATLRRRSAMPGLQSAKKFFMRTPKGFPSPGR